MLSNPDLDAYVVSPQEQFRRAREIKRRLFPSAADDEPKRDEALKIRKAAKLTKAQAVARKRHAEVKALRKRAVEMGRSLEWQRGVRKIIEDHGVTMKEVRSGSRRVAFVATRRAIAVYLRSRGWSLPAIAKVVGVKDHTTVINLLAQRNKRKPAP